MNEIDWSKAPKGATHFDPNSKGFPWEKRDGDSWYYWDDLTARWESFNTSGDHRLKCSGALITRPAAWSGEGLPPVGTICEFLSHKDTWIQVRVISHLVEMQPTAPAVIAQINETGPLCISKPSDFRPLRTPEQIAAEEREKAIEALRADTDWILDRTCAQAVLAAGYRKVEGGAS